MPLTVLTDGDVKELLHALTQEDIALMQHNLAEALHEYSTGDTNCLCASSYQPARAVIKRKGVTTLFMPASITDAVGMKIVSLETPAVPTKKGSISSVTSQMSGATLSQSSTMSSSASSISGSSFQPPASVASSASTAPRGSVTVLDSTGYPKGIINAEELTAFRTALAATFGLNKRAVVHTITVFGAGKQAYWHIRLALLLKGSDIRHINIINRSFDRAIRLMKSFQATDAPGEEWKKNVKFSALSPEFVEYGRLLKEQVRKADGTPVLLPTSRVPRMTTLHID